MQIDYLGRILMNCKIQPKGNYWLIEPRPFLRRIIFAFFLEVSEKLAIFAA